MTQGVQEQVIILPAVEPEAHLFDVCRDMLCVEMMPGSDNSGLESKRILKREI
jgi:hypothetical protein